MQHYIISFYFLFSSPVEVFFSIIDIIRKKYSSISFRDHLLWYNDIMCCDPEGYGWNIPLPTHNKVQQNMNCVHCSWYCIAQDLVAHVIPVLCNIDVDKVGCNPVLVMYHWGKHKASRVAMIEHGLGSAHWGYDKMAAFLQMMFSNAFSLMKMCEFRWINNQSLFLRIQSNILALVQIMAWCWLSNKPIFEPMIVVLPMHICITRPEWVNTMTTDSCKQHAFWI